MMDLMVDIETLGTGHRALITQIGACHFERETGKVLATFSVNVSIKDAIKKGCEIDADTLSWWLEQGTEKMTWLKNTVTLSHALHQFREFVNKDDVAWAHATFDFPIIANTYKLLGQKCPISYRNMRDIRTLVDLANLQDYRPKKAQKTHDGLDDCIYQVDYCCEAFKRLGKAK